MRRPLGRPRKPKATRPVETPVSQAQPPSASKPSGRPPKGAGAAASATGVPELRPTMTSEALRRWAEANHVLHWLDVSAKAARSSLRDRRSTWGYGYYGYGYGYGYGYDPLEAHTLASALEAPVAKNTSSYRRKPSAGVPLPVKEAVVRTLHEVAEGARKGLAEEAARLARRQPPPQDSARRRVWDRLVPLRDAVRTHTRPREVPPRPDQRLKLVSEPPCVRYQETNVDAWCGGGKQGPILTMDLADLQDAGPTVACNCNSERNGRCSMALTALDVLLDALADPAREKALEAFAVEVTAPSWHRLVRRLDQVLALRSPDAAPPEEQVGWLVETPDGSGPDLTSVLVRPYKRGPGFKRQKLDPRTILTMGHATDQDRAAATLVASAGAFSGEDRDVEAARLHHALWLLAGHPRVFVGDDVQPWSVDRTALRLHCRRTPDGRLRRSFGIGGLELGTAELADEECLLQGGQYLTWFDYDRRRCLIWPSSPDQRRLLNVFLSAPEELDFELLPALFQRWPAAQEHLPLELGPELRGREVAPSERVRLQLELLPGEALRLEARVQPLPAAGQVFMPGEGPAELYATAEDGERVYVRRPLADEPRRVRAQLASLPFPEAALEPDTGFDWTIELPQGVIEILVALQAPEAQERFDVYWVEDRSLRVTRAATAADLSLHVSQNRDWLGIHGKITIDGVEVPLEALLEAVRAGRRWVRVDERVLVQLERHFVEQLERAAEGIHGRRQRLEVSALHAPAFQELTDAGAALDAPERWQKLVTALQKSGASTPRLPRGLKAELRDYQKTGYQWLARLAEWAPGACLADDMGLGKTVQALALLLRRAKLGPALVVAPTSVNHNWIRETERFAPGLRPLAYHGPQRAELLERLKAGDLLVTSYALFVRDAEALAARSFATVVWDEAQALKNPASRRAQAAATLGAGFHLALTGTPVENRTAELWSLFRILLPGLLGSQEHFRERFVLPIERDADIGRRQSLSRILRPFVLRRHKREVERELPERTEIDLDVELGAAEQQIYERVRLEAIVQLASEDGTPAQQRRFQVLAALTRLRQIACHPALYEAEWRESSAKLEALRELVAELRDEGHQILIFSQFTSFLDLARQAIEQDGARTLTLQGSTPELQRRELVDRFQAGEAEVFLISLRAGGVGLNLTAATYVVLLDPWWNPAVEAQAADRAHRIGQTRPVTIYRLIARGTVEESIVALQAEKRALVQGLLEGTGTAEQLSTDELLRLMQQALAPAD